MPDRVDALICGMDSILTLVLGTEQFIEKVALECLNVALDITDSKFGFVAHVKEQTPELLDTLAMSDMGWSECEMPRQVAVKAVKSMPIVGMFGEVFKTGEAVIVNDVELCDFSVGVPDGHPKIESFVGIPLKGSQRVFGAICVANRVDGYEEKDVEYLKSLSTSFSIALKYAMAMTELREKNDMVLEQQQKKYSLLDSLEHELRTPLGSIEIIASNIAEGVYDSNVDKMKEKSGKNIHRHVVQARSILNRMLVFGKDLVEPLEEETQYVNLGEFLDEMKEVPLVPNYLKSIVTVDVDTDGLDEIWVQMSWQSMLSVFGNLLINASEAVVSTGEDGNVSIFVVDCDDEFVEIVVKDSGPGIKDREGIFFGHSTKEPEPEFQVYGRRGHGLKIVKTLVERWGGEIELKEYEEAFGAEFHVKLKLFFHS